MNRSIIFFSLSIITNVLLTCERRPVFMSESFSLPTRTQTSGFFSTPDFKLKLSDTYYFIKTLQIQNPAISNVEIGTAFISKISTEGVSKDCLSPRFKAEVEAQLYDAEAMVRDIHDKYTTDDIAHHQAFGLVCAFSTILKRK